MENLTDEEKVAFIAAAGAFTFLVSSLPIPRAVKDKDVRLLQRALEKVGITSEEMKRLERTAIDMWAR